MVQSARLIQGVVLACLLICCSCGSREETDRTVTYAVPVETLSVRSKTISDSVEYTGRAEPFREVTVSARWNGRVERVRCREGDRVKKGELLAELDSSELLLQVKQAKARLDLAGQNLEKVKAPFREEEIREVMAQAARAAAVLSEAQNDVKRLKQLHRQGSISDAAFEKATLGLETALNDHKAVQARLSLMKKGARKEDIRIAEVRVKQAEYSLADATDRLGKTKIASPMDGIVSRKFIEAGEYVHTAMPVFEVLQLDPVKFKVDVSETDIARINSKTKCEIDIDALDRRNIQAEIFTISMKADSKTRNFKVEVILENPGLKIKAGLIAAIRFHTRNFFHVLAVPKSAMAIMDGEKGVFVVEDATVRFQKIKYREVVGNMIIVQSGLSEGTDIVYRGGTGLRDGDAVKAEKVRE